MIQIRGPPTFQCRAFCTKAEINGIPEGHAPPISVDKACFRAPSQKKVSGYNLQRVVRFTDWGVLWSMALRSSLCLCIITLHCCIVHTSSSVARIAVHSKC